jgi:ketosteroid isomerase-like protein
MSNADVEVVRAAIEAFREGFTRGDDGAAWDTGLLAADAEWMPAPEIPGPRSYRGREGFVEFMRTWTAEFEDWWWEVEELIDAGQGRVVVLIRQGATGRASGAKVDIEYAAFYELAGGVITRIRNYLTRAEALAAAGVA